RTGSCSTSREPASVFVGRHFKSRVNDGLNYVLTVQWVMAEAGFYRLITNNLVKLRLIDHCIVNFRGNVIPGARGEDEKSKNQRRLALNKAHRLLSLLLLGLLVSVLQAGAQTLPQFGHVTIVLLENTDYSSSVGSMPYLDSLVAKYGLATNYYADTHPSIGNYFTLTTGQILTNDDGATPSSFPISQANIASLLQAAGKTWKDYPETSGTYYVRHDPL